MQNIIFDICEQKYEKSLTMLASFSPTYNVYLIITVEHFDLHFQHEEGGHFDPVSSQWG